MKTRGGKEVEYKEQTRTSKKKEGSEASKGGRRSDQGNGESTAAACNPGPSRGSESEDVERMSGSGPAEGEQCTSRDREADSGEVSSTEENQGLGYCSFGEHPDSTTEADPISETESEEEEDSDEEVDGVAEVNMAENENGRRRGDDENDDRYDRPKKKESPIYTRKMDFYGWRSDFRRWIDRYKITGRDRVYELMDAIPNDESKLRPRSLKMQLREMADDEEFFNRENYYEDLMETMERIVYGESWERMKERYRSFFRWERPDDMDVEEFLCEFRKRLKEVERASGQALGNRIKIIALMDTCKIGKAG